MAESLKRSAPYVVVPDEVPLEIGAVEHHLALALGPPARPDVARRVFRTAGMLDFIAHHGSAATLLAAVDTIVYLPADEMAAALTALFHHEAAVRTVVQSGDLNVVSEMALHAIRLPSADADGENPRAAVLARLLTPQTVRLAMEDPTAWRAASSMAFAAVHLPSPQNRVVTIQLAANDGVINGVAAHGDGQDVSHLACALWWLGEGYEGTLARVLTPRALDSTFDANGVARVATTIGRLPEDRARLAAWRRLLTPENIDTVSRSGRDELIDAVVAAATQMRLIAHCRTALERLYTPGALRTLADSPSTAFVARAAGSTSYLSSPGAVTVLAGLLSNEALDRMAAKGTAVQIADTATAINKVLLRGDAAAKGLGDRMWARLCTPRACTEVAGGGQVLGIAALVRGALRLPDDRRAELLDALFTPAALGALRDQGNHWQVGDAAAAACCLPPARCADVVGALLTEDNLRKAAGTQSNLVMAPFLQAMVHLPPDRQARAAAILAGHAPAVPPWQALVDRPPVAAAATSRPRSPSL